MKTREQLKTEYENELRKLDLQEVIMSSLSESARAPRTIMITSIESRAPWISYKAETIDDAMAIVEAFNGITVDSLLTKGTFTTAQPRDLYKPADLDRTTEEMGVRYWIEVSAGSGFSSARIVFYAFPGNRFIRVNVDIEHYPYQWNARKLSGHYDRDGNAIGFAWQRSTSMADDRAIQYWSSPGSYHHNFYYCDIHNFRAAMSQFIKPETETGSNASNGAK